MPLLLRERDERELQLLRGRGGALRLGVRDAAHTAMAPSSSTSASIAWAAPSGSPRVSRTATLTPEPSRASETPCRIASPHALVVAGERHRDAEHVRPHEGEAARSAPRSASRPPRSGPSGQRRNTSRAAASAPRVVAQVEVDPRELHRERLLHRRVLRERLRGALATSPSASRSTASVARASVAAPRASPPPACRRASRASGPRPPPRPRRARRRRARGRLGARLGGELLVQRPRRREPVARRGRARCRRGRAGTSPRPRAGRAGAR